MEEEGDEVWQVVSSSRCYSRGSKAPTEKKMEYGGAKTRHSPKFAIPKRGKRSDRDSYREDARRMPKTQRTDEADAAKRPVLESKRESSEDHAHHIGNNVSNLIGRPVVLTDRALGGSQQARRDERRPGNRVQRGGLLFVNQREAFSDNVTPTNRRGEEDAQFNVWKESWPGMEGSVPPPEEVSDSHAQENALSWCGWSDVVKSAPKPRPLTKPKAVLKEESGDGGSDGNSDSADEDEEVGGGGGDNDRDERRKPGKKKKKKKKKGGSSDEVRRSDQPITLAFGDMFALLEQTGSTASAEKARHQQTRLVFGTAAPPQPPPTSKQLKMDVKTADKSAVVPRNLMDSSAPKTMRGKEKEGPKKKKPSSLRKVITKEKEEKKRLRELGEPIPVNFNVMLQAESSPAQPLQDDCNVDTEPTQQDPSIVPLPKGLHNRKFREYCDHMITKEIDDALQDLLQDLSLFQDRVYHNEPLKFRTKRRFVCGLHETTKHLKLGKIRCIVLPPDLERIQSTGGIDEHVQVILSYCGEKNIPVVFAMTRRRLGWVMKRHSISCIGIFSYAGAEKKFRRLMELVVDARIKYEERRNLGLPVAPETNTHDDDTLVPEPVVDQSDDEDSESRSEASSTEQADSKTLPSSEWAKLFEPDPPISTVKKSETPPQAGMNRGNRTFFWNPNAPVFQPQFQFGLKRPVS